MEEIKVYYIEIKELHIEHQITKKERIIQIKNNIELKKIFANKNYKIIKIILIKKDTFDNLEKIIIDMEKKEDYNYKKYFQLVKDLQDNKICIKIIKEQDEIF